MNKRAGMVLLPALIMLAACSTQAREGAATPVQVADALDASLTWGLSRTCVRGNLPSCSEVLETGQVSVSADAALDRLKEFLERDQWSVQLGSCRPSQSKAGNLVCSLSALGGNQNSSISLVFSSGGKIDGSSSEVRLEIFGSS